MIAARSELGVDETVERAERAARLMAANGYRRRAHPRRRDTLDNGLTSVEALAEVRRRVGDLIDVQIVALAGHPVAGTAAPSSRPARWWPRRSRRAPTWWAAARTSSRRSSLERRPTR